MAVSYTHLDVYKRQVKVEVVAAGTGELCNRIAAESANPIADVLWGGGADSLAAFKDYFAPYVCCLLYTSTGTDAPGNQVKETAVAPVPTVPATSPASETTAEEIKIVPLS